MIFLSHCPDQLGLVAKISAFFAERNLNIENLEEHAERGQFFCRIEASGKEDFSQFHEAFSPIARAIQMDFQIFDEQKKTKLVLFCSESLPCPLEIISQMLAQSLPIEICAIVSNFRRIEDIARKFDIPFLYIPTDNAEYEKIQLQSIQAFSPDLVALARYMKILSAEFLNSCSVPILNIHHSFLPSFIGGKPYEMAFERGVKLIGATAHFATENLDEGPIIAQAVLPVGHSLSAEEMKIAGAQIEKSVFAEAIKKFSEHKILEFRGRTIVFR